jgi:hypothetical protein
MNSNLPGTSISYNEVTSITALGFWLITDDREYFVPFKDYPAFRSATVAQIYAMQQLSATQLYWPGLDIDIELDALEHPESYPLTFKA